MKVPALKLEFFTFLDWWNEQTIKKQQEWFTRHTKDNDTNWKVAVKNQKVRKQRKK